MAVTIKDVAREANVATSTVSRVLSNNAKISDKTKKKVQEAIEKLNYRPNAIARGLANNKTRILGVVLPNEAQDLFANPFFLQAMKGMSLYAQSKDYYITYAFSKDEESEKKYIMDFTNSKLVDGICLLRAKDNDEMISYLKGIDFPFVVIGRPEDTDGVLWVDNDNFQAMYSLVNKLVSKGHKDIGLVYAKKDWNVSKDRLKGYEVACEMNGININRNIMACGEEYSEKSGYEVMKGILKENKLSAVIATDDLLAFGAIRALEEKELNDIAIVGFNNIPLDEFKNPKLASVDINPSDLGYYATKLLIDKLENTENETKHYIVETELIERESFR